MKCRIFTVEVTGIFLRVALRYSSISGPMAKTNGSKGMNLENESG
jgi:hypothetical protein